jgi:hypothetical protein
MSEFIKIDSSGNLISANMPSQLFDGGFCYPGDWLNINVNEKCHNNQVEELTVKCGSRKLKGCSLNYSPENQSISTKTIQNMFISNFKAIWYKE